jgi:hypothetical protein
MPVRSTFYRLFCALPDNRKHAGFRIDTGEIARHRHPDGEYTLFQFQIKIASILSGIGSAPARAGAKTVGFVRSRRALLQP